MIVHTLRVSDADLRPSKKDPVLLVDPDTVMPPPVPLQRLQMVAGRNPQILDGVGVVENEQLGPSSTLEVRRTDLPSDLRVFAVEDILGAFVTEGQDHVSMIARLVCYYKNNSASFLRKEDGPRASPWQEA